MELPLIILLDLGVTTIYLFAKSKALLTLQFLAWFMLPGKLNFVLINFIHFPFFNSGNIVPRWE